MFGTAQELLKKIKSGGKDDFSKITIVLSDLKDVDNFFLVLKSRGLLCDVKSLSLFSCNLQSVIPDTVFEMEHLRCLCITKSKLTVVAANIERLRFLEDLILTDNVLISLPASISTLACLKSLLVSGNFLSEIPSQFAQLQSLQNVDIGFNKFKELSICLSQLAQLKYLTITENPLVSIPDCFAILLTHCEIIFNNCQALPKQSFLFLKEKLQNLKLVGSSAQKLQDLSISGSERGSVAFLSQVPQLIFSTIRGDTEIRLPQDSTLIPIKPVISSV